VRGIGPRSEKKKEAMQKKKRAGSEKKKKKKKKLPGFARPGLLGRNQTAKVTCADGNPSELQLTNGEQGELKKEGTPPLKKVPYTTTGKMPETQGEELQSRLRGETSKAGAKRTEIGGGY